jgi:hypothetical protein
VELRTILEKMRPMDQKLKYQIEKLIRNAADGKSDSSDPLKHKANLDNLEVFCHFYRFETLILMVVAFSHVRCINRTTVKGKKVMKM